MFVLFEEDGAFKGASILVDQDATLQVETTHGKRIKLKRNHVLLSFPSPAAGELLSRAQEQAALIDVDLLWECSPEAEFAFVDLAQEYYGHRPDPVESASLLFCLQAHPLHFHRKGRGCFRKAPPEILQAALLGQEKKRQQALAIDHMRQTLVAGALPEGFREQLGFLLYKPDRNRPEVKAIEAACVETGLSAARLFLHCGALSSTYRYHFERFIFDYFPDGIAFPEHAAPTLPTDLPLADVRAFSIDDATTTEIDDAFSVTPRPEGGWRIGIHIAAPALGFERGSSLDAIARARLSTVYMPGEKITMLPDGVVQAFTLEQGRVCPALSLYLDVNADLCVTGHETRIDRIPVVANLRHHDLEPVFNEETLLHGGPDFEWKTELVLLWELATVLEAGRGKPATNQQVFDFNYYVDWEKTGPDGPGEIRLTQRRRGAPLDKLVAEFMIAANSTWGKLMDDAGIPGLYRAQSGGKVRMTTVAAPHEGLGVDCYAWSSSPLRRYVDLVNQWQILSVLRQTAPVFAPKSVDLMSALRDFELTYAAYSEFQRRMERYWCIRWVRQQPNPVLDAHVIRDNLVRLEEVPLVFKVSGMPLQWPGSRVRLQITDSDLLDIDVHARYLETLSEPGEGSQEACLESD
jgi:exoribonuclease II